MSVPHNVGSQQLNASVSNEILDEHSQPTASTLLDMQSQSLGGITAQCTQPVEQTITEPQTSVLPDRQNQSLGETTAQTITEPRTNTADPQQATPIDEFLGSILTPVPKPLLALDFQQTDPSQCASLPQSTVKWHSMRLAQKAVANSGKGVIEIAQDLLVRKLGDLGGTDNAVSNKDPITEDFDFYAQHFARPMEKITMGAIQDLIEQGTMIQKKSSFQMTAAAAPGPMA